MRGKIPRNDGTAHVERKAKRKEWQGRCFKKKGTRRHARHFPEHRFSHQATCRSLCVCVCVDGRIYNHTWIPCDENHSDHRLLGPFSLKRCFSDPFMALLIPQDISEQRVSGQATQRECVNEELALLFRNQFRRDCCCDSERQKHKCTVTSPSMKGLFFPPIIWVTSLHPGPYPA